MMHTIGRVAFFLGLTLTTACGGCGADANNDNNPPNNTECTPGEPGCACAEGACTEGVCEMDRCVQASASGLVLDAPSARSCEILLEGSVLDVTWAEGLKGAWRKRTPRVALAISQTSDAELPASVASIMATGEVSVSTVTCFDAGGAPLSMASATFQ